MLPGADGVGVEVGACGIDIETLEEVSLLLESEPGLGKAEGTEIMR
jgi:hypothetical protein